jgi:hypothetical protein
MPFVHRLFHLSVGTQRLFWALPILLLFLHLSLEQILAPELAARSAGIRLNAARTRAEAESILEHWTVRRSVRQEYWNPHQSIETVPYERDGVIIYVTYDAHQLVVSHLGGGWTINVMSNLLLSLGSPSRRMVLLMVVLPVPTAATVFLLPLCLGVWLPDLWGGPKTLAEARTSSGHRSRVVQAWESDFYTTELIQTLPNGDERRGLIDGDVHKLWQAKLILDEAKRRVTIDGSPYAGPARAAKTCALSLCLTYLSFGCLIRPSS